MTILVILALALGAVDPAPPELPLDLVPLENVLHDEKQAVEAVHAFDQFQREMIEWDRYLLSKHEMSDDVMMVDAIQNRLHSRLQNVQQAYEIVLSHYPRNPRAINHYGDFLYDIIHDEAKALTLWHLSAQLDSSYGDPRNNLGLHYVHQGNYERGFEYLNQALELEPENPDYLYNVVQVYLVHFHALQSRFQFDKKKLYKEAMKLSKKATTLAPEDYEYAQDYATNFYASEQFGVQVNWSEAAEAWQRARAIAPDAESTFFCWLNEARAWIRDGKTERAREALQAALALNPESEAAQNLLAELEK
jgi:tetratricopeptide (TPR) repeat protein